MDGGTTKTQNVAIFFGLLTDFRAASAGFVLATAKDDPMVCTPGTGLAFSRGHIRPHARPASGSDSDGLFPIDLPGPERLAEFAAEIRQARAWSEDRFDLVVKVPPGADVGSWQTAGATWVLTSIEPQPPEPEIRAIIEAGP